MRAGSAIVAVSVVVILALAAYAVSVMHGSGNGPSDGPAPEEPGEGLTGIHVTGLPEGFSVSGDDTIMAPGEVTWHVTDNLHTFYDVSGSGSFTERYSGYDVTSPSLALDVGAYTVTAEGCEFIVVVYGDIVRSVSWIYDMDGVRVEAASSTPSVWRISCRRRSPAAGSTPLTTTARRRRSTFSRRWWSRTA